MHRVDTPPCPPELQSPARRPEWRQRLVQAERGFVGGLRSDGTLFVHFFAWTLVVLAGLVLKLHWQRWIVVGLCLSFVMTAELFHQAFRVLALPDDREPTPREVRATGLAAAAVLTAAIGAFTVIGTIFWQQLQHVL